VPLVYPKESSFYALGTWGIHEDKSACGIAHLERFEADLIELTLARGYHRYIQSEMPYGPRVYEHYFGQELYAKFRHVKQLQDPQAILNRNSVFPYKL
jgi:FAD/FMN-containing dehydrogenase